MAKEPDEIAKLSDDQLTIPQLVSRRLTTLAKNMGIKTTGDDFFVKCTSSPNVVSPNAPYEFEVHMKAKSLDATYVAGSLSEADKRSLEDRPDATLNPDPGASIVTGGGKLQPSPAVAARFYYESLGYVGRGSFGQVLNVIGYKAKELRQAYTIDGTAAEKKPGDFAEKKAAFLKLFDKMEISPDNINGDFLNRLIHDVALVMESDFYKRPTFVNEFSTLDFVAMLADGVPSRKTPDNPEGNPLRPLQDQEALRVFFLAYQLTESIFQVKKGSIENDGRVFTITCPKTEVDMLRDGLGYLLDETTHKASPQLRKNVVLASALQAQIPLINDPDKIHKKVHEVKFLVANTLGKSTVQLYAFKPEEKALDMVKEYGQLLKDLEIDYTTLTSPLTIGFTAPEDLMPVIDKFSAALQERRFAGEGKRVVALQDNPDTIPPDPTWVRRVNAQIQKRADRTEVDDELAGKERPKLPEKITPKPERYIEWALRGFGLFGKRKDGGQNQGEGRK